MGNLSMPSINPTSTPLHEPASLDAGETVHFSAVRREGGDPPPVPVPIPVEPLQEIHCPPTPTTPVDQGFCDPSAHLCCFPRPLDVFHDVRNTSAASTSSRGESNRPCRDYRRLNKLTIPDRYPIPIIKDTQTTLNGCNSFSVIDV